MTPIDAYREAAWFADARTKERYPDWPDGNITTVFWCSVFSVMFSYFLARTDGERP